MSYAPESFLDEAAVQEFVEAMQSIVTPLALIISIIYYSLEIFLAATPGKMLLGIQIANDNKTKAAPGILITRFIVKLADYVFTALLVFTASQIFNTLGNLAFIIILIGFFFTLAEKRQAFHDMLFP